MAFNVQRTERKTEYWKDNTPNVVAPGSYDVPTGVPSSPSFGKGQAVPFNSVKEREDHFKVNNFPGPGYYQKNFTVNENRISTANESNSFATKVSRFAPSAPGSTVFNTSTSFFNPGPGTYYK